MHLYQISSTLKSLSKKLSHEYIAPGEADAIARQILAMVTGYTNIKLLTQPELQITANEWEKAHQLVAEHIDHAKPLAYIFGEQPFLNLLLTIRPPILVPRPETEWWCNNLIEELQALPLTTKNKLSILDLCTGSGCIALAIAQAIPDAQVIGVDINPKSVKIAQENATKHTITNAQFITSDLFVAIQEKKFDLIVANPPYIDEIDYKKLPQSVHKWEDKNALWAPDMGTAIIKKIVAHAPQVLTQKLFGSIPRLWIEIGYNQKYLEQKFSTKTLPLHTRKDLYGSTRLLCEKI